MAITRLLCTALGSALAEEEDCVNGRLPLGECWDAWESSAAVFNYDPVRGCGTDLHAMGFAQYDPGTLGTRNSHELMCQPNLYPTLIKS